MMAAARFDEVIHAPIRLRACVMLAAVKEAEFSALREGLGVADSVLSKHLKILADAGYAELRKPTGLGGRPKTWVRLTKEGRTALRGHLEALQELARQAEAPGD